MTQRDEPVVEDVNGAIIDGTIVITRFDHSNEALWDFLREYRRSAPELRDPEKWEEGDLARAYEEHFHCHAKVVRSDLATSEGKSVLVIERRESGVASGPR